MIHSVNTKNIDNLVTPLLTDMYQISMTYGYWKNKCADSEATFDLFFRKNPFHGQYTVFAGMKEVVKFIRDFKFTEDDLAYIKTYFPDDEFIEYLSNLNTKNVKVYGYKEGTICFPRAPLLRIEGPMSVCQLLETTLLCLVNFPTLITTNASRFTMAAGKGKSLMEFGLRRAQGPDGAMSASLYSLMGGFTSTSNVLAGKLFGTKAVGTMAHSFIQSFNEGDKLPCSVINGADLLAEAKAAQKVLGYEGTNESELIAFVAYAYAFPTNFLALIDTYHTLDSGVRNFLSVAVALHKAHHKAVGVRLDSGDLAMLSKECRKEFIRAGEVCGIEYFRNFVIVASNDINEAKLHELNAEGHEIDSYGIGTNLVTCEAQPALGGVYKLVDFNGKPRIKFSQDTIKITIPATKTLYRLYQKKDGVDRPVADVLLPAHSLAVPKAGEAFDVALPFDDTYTQIVPSKVEELYHLFYSEGKVHESDASGCLFPSIEEIRKGVLANTIDGGFDPEIVTDLPTEKQYPVYLSKELNQLCIAVKNKEQVL